MVVRAASWDSGVIPAQQLESTVISTSGKNAFVIRAFETTHISVQTPTISTSIFSSGCASPFSLIKSARFIEPNVFLSM